MNQKIKNTTLNNNFQNDGFKDVNIKSKTFSLQSA